MSNVTSRPMEDGKIVAKPSRPMAPVGPGINKVIAAILWVLACVTTYQLIRVVRPDISGWLLVAVAVGAQVVFTAMERPTLIGKPNRISLAVLLVDTFINAGGIYPMALRMPETPPAQMLISAFNLSPTMSPFGGALLAIFLGFLLAASPEAVWRWKE
jgi:hypothetical protein